MSGVKCCMCVMISLVLLILQGYTQPETQSTQSTSFSTPQANRTLTKPALAQKKHGKVRIEKIKFKDAAEAREFVGATADNQWIDFLCEVGWGKNRVTDLETGEITEGVALKWKTIEIPDDWKKPNGKVDKAKIEKATGMKWNKLREKNPELEVE